MDQSLDVLRAENAQLKRDLEQALAHHATTSANDARRYNFIEAMLDTMPIGVVMADAPSGKIVFGNKRAEDLVRHPVYESEDTDSYGEWVSFHEDGTRVQSHEYPLAKVIADGQDYAELDVNYQRGDGTMFWMRIICRPVCDADGQIIGAAVALIDIDNERHLVAQQSVLIAELNHRVKNAFTVVKSIVSQSLRNTEASGTVRSTIDQRLDAYAKAHSQLIGKHWDRASIHDVARDTVGDIADGRISLSGPKIEVPSRSVMALSMAFYELATNAMKHGSLSDPRGRVALSWQIVTPDQIRLDWVELDGPTPVIPTTSGFGSKIINQILVAETYGKVTIDYPSTGFEWSLTMPVKEG
ncbi:MAG: HWE histidine kinase domain-containing protein [Yoonia sp.]|uniref:HWE histidine kinase domain-containing protein n=1 Tax=Yoonia sp. TaxID=2212373 RepID=UPI003EF7671A